MKNVLLITADQWRADCLSALSHPVVSTPNIDALARRGVLFRRHYAQCIPCGPSRASLYTGMYLQNHRSVANSCPLDSRFTNIALECRKLGYDPKLVGYTDTTPDPRDYHPNDPALTTYHGVIEGMTSLLGETVKGVPAVWVEYLRSEGYEVPDDPYELFRPVDNYPESDHRGVTFPPPVFHADESDTAFQTNAAVSFIEARHTRPWFLHVSYGRPHPPYSVCEPYNSLYHPDSVPPFRRAATPAAEAQQHPFVGMLLAAQERGGTLSHDRYPRDDRNMRQLRATYYGMMHEVDHHIGRLVDAVDCQGVSDETIVIFTSDHGDQLGDHWLLGKGAYFDQGFAVPLIVSDPSNESDSSRGTVVDRFTESVDVMPTLLELLGAEVPLQCDGASLVPFLKGDSPARWRSEAHFEIDFRDAARGRPELELGIRFDECVANVIRGEHYKYVHFPALAPLLFDLQSDPDELVNLAGDPAYLPQLYECAARLISWRMVNDERLLTGMRVSAEGVIERRRSTWGDHVRPGTGSLSR